MSSALRSASVADSINLEISPLMVRYAQKCSGPRRGKSIGSGNTQHQGYDFFRSRKFIAGAADDKLRQMGRAARPGVAAVLHGDEFHAAPRADIVAHHAVRRQRPVAL